MSIFEEIHRELGLSSVDSGFLQRLAPQLGEFLDQSVERCRNHPTLTAAFALETDEDHGPALARWLREALLGSCGAADDLMVRFERVRQILRPDAPFWQLTAAFAVLREELVTSAERVLGRSDDVESVRGALERLIDLEMAIALTARGATISEAFEPLVTALSTIGMSAFLLDSRDGLPDEVHLLLARLRRQAAVCNASVARLLRTATVRCPGDVPIDIRALIDLAVDDCNLRDGVAVDQSFESANKVLGNPVLLRQALVCLIAALTRGVGSEDGRIEFTSVRAKGSFSEICATCSVPRGFESTILSDPDFALAGVIVGVHAGNVRANRLADGDFAVKMRLPIARA